MEVALRHGHQVTQDDRLRMVLLVPEGRSRAQVVVLVLVLAVALVQ